MSANSPNPVSAAYAVMNSQNMSINWYQKAFTMHALGLFFIAMGLALAATTTTFAIQAIPITNKIIIMGTGSFISFVIAIALLTKTYWKDPNFQLEKVKEFFIALKEHGYKYAKVHHSEIRKYVDINSEEIRNFIIKDSELVTPFKLLFSSKDELLKDDIIWQDAYDTQFRLNLENNENVTFQDVFSQWNDFDSLDRSVSGYDMGNVFDRFTQNLRWEYHHHCKTPVNESDRLKPIAERVYSDPVNITNFNHFKEKYGDKILELLKKWEIIKVNGSTLTI